MEGIETARIVAKLREALVVSTKKTSKRVRRRARDGELIQVFRHVYVHVEALRGTDIFEVRLRVAIVRALAVACALGSGCALSHVSAALIHGVPMVKLPSEVHVCVPKGRHPVATKLQQIQLPGVASFAPEPVVTHYETVPRTEMVSVVCDAKAVELPVAAVQCARSLPAKEGIVVVSGALRILARFSRFDMALSRRREEFWRDQLLTVMANLPARNGIRKARLIIDCADAACESVPERILLWVLRAGGFRDVISQVEHIIRGRRYFTDFELPVSNGGFAIEYDGKGKYGCEVGEVLDSLTARDQRQKDLESAGITVVRFEGFELARPDQIVAEIAARSGNLPRRRVPRILREQLPIQHVKRHLGAPCLT